MKSSQLYNVVNSRKSLLLAVALVLLISASARAADFKLIANNSVSASSVSTDDIKQVFLENKDSLDGNHVQPVLSKGGASHDAFLKKCIDKSDGALQNYYRSLVFSGKGMMPKALASDAEIVAYVAKTKGAIGYVSGDANSAGVKVLQLK